MVAVVAVFMVAVAAALAVAAGESERPGLISVVAGIDRRRAVVALAAVAVAAVDTDRRRVAVVAVVARMSGHRQVAVAAVDTDRRRVVVADTGHPHPHRPLIGTGVIL